MRHVTNPVHPLSSAVSSLLFSSLISRPDVLTVPSVLSSCLYVDTYLVALDLGNKLLAEASAINERLRTKYHAFCV